MDLFKANRAGVASVALVTEPNHTLVCLRELFFHGIRIEERTERGDVHKRCCAIFQKGVPFAGQEVVQEEALPIFFYIEPRAADFPLTILSLRLRTSEHHENGPLAPEVFCCRKAIPSGRSARVRFLDESLYTGLTQSECKTRNQSAGF